jgi:hypothetical protein
MSFYLHATRSMIYIKQWFFFRFIVFCIFIIELTGQHLTIEFNKYTGGKIKHGVTKNGPVDDVLSGLDDLFFEIVQPQDIQYTYRVRMAKDFGSYFKKVYKNIPLVPFDPYDGCTKIRNVEKVKGKVALVRRGECVFLTKCLNAENAGAVAVIVTDNDFANEYLVDMIGDESGRVCNIPSLFLTWKDGLMIKKSLEKNSLNYAIINIPLNLTFKTENQFVRKAPWSLS